MNGYCAGKSCKLLIPIATLLLCSIACNVPGIVPSAPVVQIQAPDEGATLPVNQTVVVSALATDANGPGVTRVELFINGESETTIESPTGPRDVFDAAFSWIPPQEGQIDLSVVAYRPDDSPSQPAKITVTITGMTSESTESPSTSPSPSTTSAAESTTETGEPVIPGRVVMDANVRIGPGPACGIVGGVKTNQMINLYEYSADRRWIRTEINDRPGWIFATSVAPTGDTSILPIGNARGCAGCGDHVCSSKESCSVCSRDCGTCVPPTATPIPTRTPKPTSTTSGAPTITNTAKPTKTPRLTNTPTELPTNEPTVEPTTQPTTEPTQPPTQEPTVEPTIGP